MAFAAAISIGSSVSSSGVEEASDAVGGVTPNEVAFHLGEFAFFALLIYRLLRFHLRWPFHYLAFLVLLVAAGYGAIDELHQRFVPGRASSLSDVAWDALGAAITLGLVGGVVGIRKVRKRGAA
ncbi:MAG: VanZ family protein [Dehalococcoidia bacterium]